ncbi:MAG: hypothetical protein WCE94_14190 [Candidatus Methanoperedens sp.]
MKKYQREIYYNPYQLPPRTFWNINVEVTRSEAGKFCEGLYSVISELMGGAFYYPDIKTKKTNHRYEWQIPFGKKKFGIRLGIIFSISKEDLKTVEVYATYGDESEKYGSVPSFSENEISKFNDEIERVIKRAFNRSTPENQKPYHIIFYIELPPIRRIADIVKLPEFGVTVFPTVILRKDSKRVSAITITVDEYSSKTAKAVALQQITTVCALLTLARGSIYKLYYPEWPKNRKPIEVLDSIDQLTPLEILYPYRRWQPCTDNIDDNFSECLKKILTLYYSLSESNRTEFIDPLFAYYAGKELHNNQNQPTLSVVAFLAALSPFGKAERCPGEVSCSICGKLKFDISNPFRHNLIGDRIALVNSLCEIFNINPSSEMYDEVNLLITRLYREQRSAFVHGAMLRHGEYYRNYNLPATLPTSEAPYSDMFLYRRDLSSLEPLVRRALLILLSNETGIPLDENLFGLGELGIYRETVYEGSITLPKNTKVYPCKNNYSKQDNP